WARSRTRRCWRRSLVASRTLPSGSRLPREREAPGSPGSSPARAVGRLACGASSASLKSPPKEEASEMAAAEGARAWVGKTHTLVIDALGQVFTGPNALAQFGPVGGGFGVTGWAGL